MLQIETIVVGPIETNCYLVANPLRQVLIIDPGFEPAKIISRIKAGDLTPAAILNTHGHYDHILADMELKRRYRVPLFFPKTDQYLIAINQKLYPLADFQPDFYYNQQILVEGFELRVIDTPGHSKGSTCFLIEDKLFSGDTLFAEGYLGRTDLWGGSQPEIKASLQKLLTLPDNTTIYPGHGPLTTIGAERAYYV